MLKPGSANEYSQNVHANLRHTLRGHLFVGAPQNENMKITDIEHSVA